jgi:hypothetical protein
MSSTRKTLEHIIPAYSLLPEGADTEAAAAEAAQPAQAAEAARSTQAAEAAPCTEAAAAAQSEDAEAAEEAAEAKSCQADVRDFLLSEDYRCGVLRRYIVSRTN